MALATTITMKFEPVCGQIGQIGWEGHIGWEGQIVLGGQMGGPGWPDWLGSQTGLNLILHLVDNSTLSTKRLS